MRGVMGAAPSFERGIYNEQRDKWSNAWHEYETGLKKSPGSVKLGLAAGRAAFVLGRYDDKYCIRFGKLAEIMRGDYARRRREGIFVRK